jgi:replicative DNA helicase
MKPDDVNRARGGNRKPTAVDAPVNLDAEQILLASAIVDNRIYEALADKIPPGHFHDPFHVQAWEAIGSLNGRGKRAEAASLLPYIKAAPPNVEEHPENYLRRLRAQARTLSDIDGIVEAVIAAAEARSIRDICSEYGDLAKQAKPGLIEEFAGDVNRLISGPAGEHYGYAGSSVDAILQGIRAKRQMAPGSVNGLSTGFPKLDKLIDGLCPEAFYVFGARPKMGKTNFLLTIIRHLASNGIPVVFFSVELTRDQILKRLIAMQAQIDFTSMVRGTFNDDEDLHLAEAVMEIERWPLIIDDSSRLTTSQLARRARQAVNVEGARAVFIDYLQLLRPDKESGRSYEDATRVSQAVADLRKTLKVPIVALAQLNRKVEGRQTAVDFEKYNAAACRPNAADIRETGQIEQDADVLGFITRPVIALEDLKPVDTDRLHDWEGACLRLRNIAEVSVHLNRSGPRGFVDMKFIGSQSRFEEQI